MIDRARVECQNHWFIYNERMSVESCAQAVSTLAIQFGDSADGGSAMSRPFGVAILFAGIENDDPQLWHMDPSGTYIRYDAKAIGSGSEGAQQNLQVLCGKHVEISFVPYYKFQKQLFLILIEHKTVSDLQKKSIQMFDFYFVSLRTIILKK